MKKITITLFALMLTLSAMAQAPTIQWQKALGGTFEDQGIAIAQTTDGGYITAGYAISEDGNVTGSHGGEDFWVVKLTNTGTISWQKALGGSGSDVATGIVQTTDGSYIVSGYTDSEDGDVTGLHGFYDFWAVKLSATGSIVWQKTYGGTEGDLAYTSAATSDGGCIMAGYTGSYDGDITENQDNGDVWVVKINSVGTIVWQKSYGGSDYEYMESIKQTVDGGYVMAGKTWSNDHDVSGNHGDLDYWVVRINSTGTILWQKTLGGTEEDEATGIIETSDGGFVVTGIISSSNGNITGYHDDYDGWVAKLNASGVLQWQKALGGTGADRVFDVVEYGGGYVVLGCPQSRNGDLVLADDNTGSYWLVKFSTTGAIQWKKTYGGSEYDEPDSFIKTSDGGFAITGYTYSFDGDVTGNHGDSDYWVLKLSGELGNETFGNNSVRLYPNPAHNLLQVEDSNNTITAVKIIDLTGKVLLQQDQDFQNINVENLAIGMYVVEVYSDKAKQTAKFIKQ